MSVVEFSSMDRQDLSQRGIDPETVVAQVEMLRRGLPFACLERPCSAGDGITVLSDDERDRLSALAQAAADQGRLTKFVPASGAASRMFKSLHAARGRCDAVTTEDARDEDLADLLTFGRRRREFAFYPALKDRMAADGLALDELVERGRYEAVLSYLLTDKGLNYGHLPKAMILFHGYPDHSRTALEEHLVEAAATIRAADGGCRLHFTVSPQHEGAMYRHATAASDRHSTGGIRFQCEFSCQDPSTDTVAVDDQGQLFRDRQKQMVFRPGGHGALLRNLGNLNADLVSIKNIDNVVPDRLKRDAQKHLSALAGLLVERQQQVFEYVARLKQSPPTTELIAQIEAFAKAQMGIERPVSVTRQSAAEIGAYWRDRLDRPLRVCGMVPNVGAPGGGPFWVRQASGMIGRQIVEQAHVDMTDDGQRGIWEAATHFNPVVLVCGMRDHTGKPFDLNRFRDPDAGFIVHKSYQGRALTGWEHPGLWNGSMAGWNTLFIEIPLTNFAPVKTVLSLLSPEHQA